MVTRLDAYIGRSELLYQLDCLVPTLQRGNAYVGK